MNIPIRDLAKNLDKLPAKDQPIVAICGSGHRSAIAMATLQMLGYTDVKSLARGFSDWKAAGLPVAAAAVAPTPGTAPEVDQGMLTALDEYLSSLPNGWGTISPADLKAQIAAGGLTLIDVRELSEVSSAGKIESSINIPIRTLTKNLNMLPPDKAAPIVVYCAIGHRGALGMMALQLLDYANVKSLAGGFAAWTSAGLPVVK